jgi:UPF0755 protein
VNRSVLVLAGFAAILIAGAGFVGWRLLTAAPAASGTADAAVEFRVDSGEKFGSVARRLEDRGLVVSATRFRILARLLRVDRGIRAGTYSFDRGTDPRRVLEDLVAGRVRLEQLTIPEGWRLEQIADAVEREFGIAPQELLAAARDPERLAAARCPSENLEGYLFPETYFFPDGVTAGEIVDAMVQRFEEVWEALDRAPPAGLDRHGVVTLASIVEAEARVPEERPRIAAVYLNRLREGWKLEADPTVRYALGRFNGKLYYKHLEVDSPYNTYQVTGLPPGPICSPGRASLLAVLEPQPSSNEFYFVASGDGRHVFSRTKAEHDEARRAVRRREREEAALRGGD